MPSVKMTEDQIRESQFSFSSTQGDGPLKCDVYTSDSNIELRIYLDANGCPEGAQFFESASSNVIIIADLDQDASETLAYEILDGAAQMTLRLTGLDEAELMPA